MIENYNLRLNGPGVKIILLVYTNDIIL